MPTLNEASPITTLGSPASANVESAYVELIASAARDTTWAILYVAPIPTHSFRAKIDIAIGGAGSEVNILNDFMLVYTGNGGDFNDSLDSICLPLKFTTGDRISIRVQDEATFGVNYHAQIRIFE